MASEKINKIQCVARNTINKVKNTVNIYKQIEPTSTGGRG